MRILSMRVTATNLLGVVVNVANNPATESGYFLGVPVLAGK